MSETEHPIFARIYDPVMRLPEEYFLRDHREYLVSDLSGAVLDLGAGTGAMFPYFADAQSDPLELHAIEPDPYMRERAAERAANVGLDVDLVDSGAETLPYDDSTFDYVVASLVFCTIPDVAAALDEVARVLKPGGEFRFVEHVRGSGMTGTLHDVVTPGWYHLAGGCHLNRETGTVFQSDDRFEVLDYRRYDSGISRLQPIVRGRLQRQTNSLLERVLYNYVH